MAKQHSPDNTTGLSAGAEFLASRGLFGLVWFDRELIVREHAGDLVDHIVDGKSITDSVIALFGYEKELHNLIRHPLLSLDIPNVAIATSSRSELRLHHHVFWHAEREQYLLLLARAAAPDALETKLYEQNRRTMLAEQKLVEQAKVLERTNQELTRANRDLSEFAYIISHDLNAPLRALRYHAEALELETDIFEDAVAKELLSGITFQSKRMSGMLRDLLEYSRIGRQEERLENVDSRLLIATILKSLPRTDTLSLHLDGDWPAITTYAAPLDLVLRNLIDNAIKHHDSGTGQITVRSEPASDRVKFSIEDDGPGIDPRYHSAIFQPFCKLAADDEDDAPLPAAKQSSGIGLALVRRTAETVGGSVSVVSDPEKRRGAVFHVFWPIVDKAVT